MLWYTTKMYCYLATLVLYNLLYVEQHSPSMYRAEFSIKKIGYSCSIVINHSYGIVCMSIIYHGC